MTVEIKGAHGYHVSDKTREYLDKKLARLKFAEELVSDLHVSLERESNGEYKCTGDIHFRWGAMSHIKTDSRDLYIAMDALFDKIDVKVSKEKDKIQDHK